MSRACLGRVWGDACLGHVSGHVESMFEAMRVGSMFGARLSMFGAGARVEHLADFAGNFSWVHSANRPYSYLAFADSCGS
eukprot:11214140-Lingulodinium_polyedra.AAC.1